MGTNNVEDVLKQILDLQREIIEKQSELEKLQGRLCLRTGSDMPNFMPDDFDIKKAIIEYFNSTDKLQNVDDVVKHIKDTYKFIVDRRTVAIRINYLVDRLHVLSRSSSRGFYIKQ